jgi:hypothetical protein
MTVQLIQFCPSLQLLQSFFRNIELKGTWHRDERLALFQFYTKTFLRSVDPKQPKMSNFHFDLSLKLSQGEVHDVSGVVQKLSGEVQNDLRGGAHLARKWNLCLLMEICVENLLVQDQSRFWQLVQSPSLVYNSNWQNTAPTCEPDPETMLKDMTLWVTHAKTHKLLQVCKQVATNLSVHKLLTSCVRTACSQLS